MAVNLRGRIGRLEGRCAGTGRASARCTACGASPSDPVAYTCEPPRVIGEDDGDAACGNETCRGCGRVLVYRCQPPRDLAAAGAGP